MNDKAFCVWVRTNGEATDTRVKVLSRLMEATNRLAAAADKIEELSVGTGYWSNPMREAADLLGVQSMADVIPELRRVLDEAKRNRVAKEGITLTPPIAEASLW